jgi:hypothetical protein
MSSNLEKWKTDLAKLIHLGDEMSLDLRLRSPGQLEKLESEYQKTADRIKGSFEKNYQRWYTESCAVLKQLLPNRLEEFVRFYAPDPKRKIVDINTYRIQDWLVGIRAAKDLYNKPYFQDLSIVSMQLSTQLDIVESVQSRFESSLHDIAQLARADLFDSEIETARELLKNRFHRAAGVIAGVVIEKHLSQVLQNHGLKPKKQHPNISDYNDVLKNASVIDVPAWRQIQRLGDIRNLCGHNKEREPTSDEVRELIEGTDKLSKTLF